MADPTIRERLRELLVGDFPALRLPVEADRDAGLLMADGDGADLADIVEAVNALPALLDELDTLERRAIATTEALGAVRLTDEQIKAALDSLGKPGTRAEAYVWTAAQAFLAARAALEASRGSAPE